MSKKYYTELPKHVVQMSPSELLEYFPQGTYITKNKKGLDIEKVLTTKAHLMRSIIMNEKMYGRVSESRTLRSMWYSCVKPTLDKLGLLKSEDNTEKGLKDWDKTLSHYVTVLLRKGFLMYSDLGIYDISRNKSNPNVAYYSVDSRAYGYQGNVTPYPNIILATEKDTVYGVLEKIADLLGCSVISCKGQNSLGAMERLIKGMFGDSDYPNFHTIQIISVTDYDPAGYYIHGALKQQAEDILFAMDKTWVSVNSVRVGIEPKQLPKSLVTANKYSPASANLEKWFDMTGGIDGEPKGLELDALSNDMIRNIVLNELEKHIDKKKYIDFIAKSYIKLKTLEFLKKEAIKISKKTEVLYEDLIVNDFDIIEHAREGWRTIHFEEICEDGLDPEIESIVSSHLS